MNKNFIKETKKIPSLINPKFKELLEQKIVPSAPEIKKSNNFILNCILLLTFIVFFAFFLYNCKYGIFKSKDYISPIAYS